MLAAGATGTVTVLMADIEGSTTLLERLGHERFMAALRAYEELLSEHVAEHGGRQFKALGDGHLLAFASARSAVRCAVALQRALPPPQLPEWRVRMGLHAGEPELREGDLHGRAVVKAVRIADLARGGEVLVSSLVRELADLDESEGEVWFDEEREVELRGLRGRHVIVTARWVADERRPLRVVIADDAAIIRDGLAALLRESGLEVVATAGDAAGLTAAVERHSPDVAIVDIRMPPTHTTEGLVAAESIRREHPQIGVLVLSQHVEPAYALQLMRGGESRIGYLLKDRVGDAEMLLEAIRRVAHGGSVVDPSLTGQLLRRADALGALGELNAREREVLVLLAEGLSNRAIAERLAITDHTVETHVGQIFLKLDLRDETSEHRRVAAVLTYLRATEA